MKVIGTGSLCWCPVHTHTNTHVQVSGEACEPQKRMCVCVQSTNMFSASSRRSNQSSLRNLSNSHPQKGLLPAGAAMSQQWQLWEEASSRPGASLPLLPGRPGRPGHCFGTDVPAHIPGTGQHRQLKGFSLLLPLPVPPHTLPSIFPSRSKTKTRHS